MTLFLKEVLLGECTGISFVDSTPLRVCKPQRIHAHKVFRGIATRGHCSVGWLTKLSKQPLKRLKRFFETVRFNLLRLILARDDIAVLSGHYS